MRQLQVRLLKYTTHACLSVAGRRVVLVSLAHSLVRLRLQIMLSLRGHHVAVRLSIQRLYATLQQELRPLSL